MTAPKFHLPELDAIIAKGTLIEDVYGVAVDNNEMDLRHLKTRLETATEPDRELFYEVEAALCVEPEAVDDMEWWLRVEGYLNVEAWDQAAIAILERKLPGWDWSIRKLVLREVTVVVYPANPRLIPISANGPTASLAILAALVTIAGNKDIKI